MSSDGVIDHLSIWVHQTNKDNQPPYAVPIAQLGGLPKIIPDVPILAVFLSYYSIASLLCLLSIYQAVRSHQPCTLSLLMYLFSGERVVACAMRIAWAYRIANVRIAVASQILLQAGVILLYLMNVIIAGRVLRTLFGHRSWLRSILAALSIMTISSLVMVITAIIVSVFTLEERSRDACLDVQRAAATYFVLLTTAPMMMLAACLKHKYNQVDGRLRSILALTAMSALLCMIMAGFKAGVIWETPRPIFSPAWYHSNICLYALGFGPEVLDLTMLFMARVDVRCNSLSNC